MYEALAKVNRTDAAIRTLLQTGFPSFGAEIYSKYEPSTMLWESWTGDTMRQWLHESSRGHHYQASINTFLRRYVAGLDMPEGIGGWSVVKVRPEASLLPADLADEIPGAAASSATHRGLVHTAWRRNSSTGTVTVAATIPAGATAELHVPLSFGLHRTRITESGRLVWAAGAPLLHGEARGGLAGIASASTDGRFAIFSCSRSGTYTFVTAQAAQ